MSSTTSINDTTDNNGDNTKQDTVLSLVDSSDTTEIVPQLASHDITIQDLQTAIKVLNAIGQLHPKFHKKNKKKNNNKRPRSPAKSKDDTEQNKGGDGESPIGNNPNSNPTNSSGEDNNSNKNANEIQEEEIDPLSLYQHSNLRPLRKALAQSFEVHKLTIFRGENPEKHYKKKLNDRTLKRQKTAETIAQQKYLENTLLRKGRTEKMKQLQMDSMEEEMNKIASHSTQEQLLLESGDGPTSQGDQHKKNLIQKACNMMIPDGHVETGDIGSNTVNSQETKQLPKLRSCYVCKVRFRELHVFYDQLCPTCAKINFEKRNQIVDLTKKIAVVTGARVKIGYQVCLKLLRAGCTVIATTRFPNAAALVYRKEADFDAWKDRLCIYGLDFRDVIGLEAFTRFLNLQYGVGGIDILINNACQTVRRPAGYYSTFFEKEQSIWKEADSIHRQLLDGCVNFEKIRQQLHLNQQQQFAGVGEWNRPALSQSKSSTLPLLNTLDEEDSTNSNIQMVATEVKEDALATTKSSIVPSTNDQSIVSFEKTGVSHSAAMSQMVLLPDDVGVSKDILPPGLSDINGQQLDLRKTNSWLLTMGEVSTPEVMECMFINAIAPFVLNSRLQPLMTIPDNDKRPDRYIINVSAMEGKFYRYKLPNHPHTNMAKAALNMLTRTSSEHLAKKHRIYMNSVDTGWINDENPLEKASKIAKTNAFQTPIDEIDAAARILDPIFTGIEKKSDGMKNDHKKEYGKFFKDYRETEW